MDKVKVYLQLLRKHHFWVLCGVVLIVALVARYQSSQNMAAEFEQSKSDIDSQFSRMDSVIRQTAHPNDNVTQGLAGEHRKAKEDVYQAWELRFQQQLKVPQWPREVFGDDFVDFIETHGSSEEIPIRFRERYQNYVKGEIKPLFTIINLRDVVAQPPMPVNPQATSGNRPLDRPKDEYEGMVAWDPAQRLALESRYDWPNRPTSLQVRYANEDLWVYRALLNILAKTNEGVKEHLFANIKKIEALNIGQQVPPPAEMIAIADPNAVAADGSHGPGGPGPVNLNPEGEGGGPPQLTGEAAINQELQANRYVDAQGNPLSAGAAAPYAEFKIMPFQMRLIMDQRKVPQLLANCANSPLPVEVRKVRMTSRKLESGGPSGAGRPNNAEEIRGRGSLGDRGASSSNPDDTTSQIGGEVEFRPYDLYVDIRGMVYIFQPPDKARFLQGGGASEGGQPGDPAGTPPAAE